jgi:hypothetical protein
MAVRRRFLVMRALLQIQMDFCSMDNHTVSDSYVENKTIYHSLPGIPSLPLDQFDREAG